MRPPFCLIDREVRGVYFSYMLKVIFWAFVLILALSFFGISIQAIINSPAGQANFNYVHGLLVQGWHWLFGVFSYLVSIPRHFIIW